jgi:hypothetical protein
LIEPPKDDLGEETDSLFDTVRVEREGDKVRVEISLPWLFLVIGVGIALLSLIWE